MKIKKIEAAIVDDEPLAREGVRTMLEKDPEIRIVAECANGKEAIVAVRKFKPDLIFLDVQMPEMDGFAVLKTLKPDEVPHIIFVTAYDQYAVRAFEVYALDYLLKPVDEERFEKALQRAKSMIGQEKNHAIGQNIQALLDQLIREARWTKSSSPNIPQYLDRLMIKTAGRIFFLKTTEIDWIEAQGNYVLLHIGKDSHLLREAISALEAKLDPQKFLRIHRSTVVNIDRIRELQSLFHGDYQVLLKDGTQLLLSRRFREKARERLGQSM